MNTIKNISDNNKTIDMLKFFDNNNIKFGIMSCSTEYDADKLKLKLKTPMKWINDKTYRYTDFGKDINFNENKKSFIDALENDNLDNLYTDNTTKCCYLSIDTKHVNIIDIDNPVLFEKEKSELLDKLQQTTSYGSRNSHFKEDEFPFRHYLVNVINKPINTKYCYSLGYGELLSGQAALCKINNKLLNNKIITIDYNELLLKKEIVKKTKEEFVKKESNISIQAYDELLMILPNESFTNYQDWLKYMFLTKSLFGQEGFDIFYKHSLRCDNSNKIDSYTDMKKKYDNLNIIENCSNGITIGTAFYDAKSNHKNKFNKWFAKHGVREKTLKDKKKEKYQELKEEFEKDNFYVKKLNCYYKYFEDDKTYVQYDKASFSNLHCDKSFIIKHDEVEKEFDLFNLWNKDSEKRSYNDVDFIPSHNFNNKKIFNSFQGFKLEPNPDEYCEESVNIFVNHIKYISNDDKESYQYLLNYLGHLFQKPEEKPDVAIVVKSIPGCGKDLLIDILSSILGNDLVARSGDISEQIFGTFNPMLENKVILQCNEVEGKDGYKNKEKLKNLITTDKIQINNKNCKLTSYKNCLRTFIFSNNDNPIYVGCESRRFAIYEIEKKQTREYYNILGSLLKNKNGLQSIYKYLLEIDINKFDTTSIPDTDAKKRMTEYNKPFIFDYLYDDVIISKNEIGMYNNYLHDEVNDIFYFNFSEFVKKTIRKAQEENIEYKISTKSLKSKLQKYKKWCSFLRKTINSKQQRVIKIDYKLCKAFLESNYKFY